MNYKTGVTTLAAASIGVAALSAAPLVALPMLGFSATGVTAGSAAAAAMSAGVKGVSAITTVVLGLVGGGIGTAIGLIASKKNEPEPDKEQPDEDDFYSLP